jgi:monoamine oxidase
MARTPLFRLIGRALKEAQTANHTHYGEAEIVERMAESRLDRRRFLATSSAAIAGVALANCAPMGMASQQRGADPVLIVGAGIAGLTAAYRLGQAGVPVRLIEAQKRIGGRMFSLRDFFPDGQVAELGGELIDTGHETIRTLAAELGIGLDDLSIEPDGIGMELFYFGGARRTEREIVEAFRPIAAQIEEDLATLTCDDVTYDAPNGAERLDRMTVAQWLDQRGVSGWIRDVLNIGYTTEFGLETDQQSALNLLTMIDTNPDPFRIFGDSDERFHVQGGNDRITTTLASKIGVEIETGTFLESLTEESDGTFVCSVRREGVSSTIRAPQVLLTIPFTMLREVDIRMNLPAAKRAAIDGLGYGTNAKLMVGFDRRVWREQYASNGSVLTDLPFQLCWETSRAQSGRSGILTNFTGGAHGMELGSGTAAEQAATFTRQLDRVFPGVEATRREGKEVRFHWPTFPFTRGSYASYRPGQWTTIRGAEGTPVRNLFFAGEHCSLDYQGFMEGGCETGQAAAEAIALSRGLQIAKRAAA